jgi:hypothetical protein
MQGFSHLCDRRAGKTHLTIIKLCTDVAIASLLTGATMTDAEQER